MKEDDVLARVRDHVRSERADDASLEAVARGETATPAVLELERRSGEDPEVAALLAASRPLGAAGEERIAAHLAPRAAPAKAEPAKVKPRAIAKPNVAFFARRAVVVAGPLALAAAVVLWGLAGRKGEAGRALLPDYAVSASSDQAMRGPADTAASTRLRLRPGDAPFEILVRPATAAGGKVVAYAFAIGEGEPNPIEAKVEVAPEGSIRVRGRSRALEGAREVRVVIGIANESIARFEDALTRARDGKSDAFVRVLSVPITRE